MLNELASVPGVTFGLHLCRGNYDSDWISAGAYDTISKRLFRRAANYDVFLLEYDDERSGSFAAARRRPRRQGGRARPGLDEVRPDGAGR